MSNEIKVGDKVRVSEKTPIEYNPHGKYAPLCVINSVVRCVVNDYAMCEPIWDDGAIQTPFLIPTKYLVKVDAEAKEPKFKCGDKVVINCAYENGEIWDKVMHGRFGTIKSIYRNAESSLWMYSFVEGFRDFAEGWLEPCAEPSLEKDPSDMTKETANNLSKVLEGYCNAMQSIADNFDWQQYTADLAKEIAVKVANKHNDPKQAADYAVKVAKAVAEGLKRK